MRILLTSDNVLCCDAKTQGAVVIADIYYRNNLVARGQRYEFISFIDGSTYNPDTVTIRYQNKEERMLFKENYSEQPYFYRGKNYKLEDEYCEEDEDFEYSLVVRRFIGITKKEILNQINLQEEGWTTKLKKYYGFM